MQWHAHYVSTALGPPKEQFPIHVHVYIHVPAPLQCRFRMGEEAPPVACTATINSEASATQTPYGKPEMLVRH